MGVNRKYLVAVALLAVLAVVFGLAGTSAPISESPLSSSSSDSVTHFMYPPTYDSGWVDITGRAGQYVTLRHDLNTTEVFVDITGKQSLDPMGGALSWNKTYGGTGTDIPSTMVQTFDGRYAIAGYTLSFGAGSADFYLVRADSSGNMLWNQTYGGASFDDAFSLIQTSDGGYALAGRTFSFGAGATDFYLVRADSSGNMLWNQTYGGTLDDAAWSIVQTSDGGFAMTGYTYSFGAGEQDFWLVKTDSAGNMLWNQTYGGALNDYVYSVVQCGDGGYALAGYTYSFGAGGCDFWLIKLNVERNLEHQRNLGTETGLVRTGLTNYTITLYRGETDPYWNYVRVRIWTIKEPTWMFGDINQDGIVDAQDLAILSRNYGKTFSALSLTGILAITSIYAYKKRKKQPE